MRNNEFVLLSQIFYNNVFKDKDFEYEYQLLVGARGSVMAAFRDLAAVLFYLSVLLSSIRCQRRFPYGSSKILSFKS